MITTDLLDYVRSAQAGGATRQAIEAALLNAGWKSEDIAQAFSSMNPSNITTPASPSPQVASSPVMQSSPIQQNGQPANPYQPTYNPSFTERPSSSHLTSYILVALVVLVLGAGGAYAYMMKIGPFGIGSVYTEENLFSGLLMKASNIDTASYSLGMSLDVVPRDVGAMPFTAKDLDNPQLLQQYKNDFARVQDLQSILSSLIYSSPYPSSLQSLKNSNQYFRFSIADPATSAPYKYSVTEGGNNFSLVVTFETSDAVAAVRDSYQFKEEGTPINGRTVTFTKDSPYYLYFSSTPPDPILVSLSKEAKSLPVDFKLSAAVSAKTDFKPDSLGDWEFNVDATGDFGDLQYKVNVDALKKDATYYFKINNMPSLLLGMFSNVKGSWVKVNPADKNNEDSISYSYNPLSEIADSFAENETSYKENRAELVQFLLQAAKFADEDKLVWFKNKPSKEKVDGRTLHRYELGINKGAILPFYQKLTVEAQKNGNTNELFGDTGMVEYLQSSAFNEMFDYYDKNTSLVIWTDEDGYPAMIQSTFRLVPPDEAEQLKDKQANLTTTLKISDINKPLNIVAPADAKSIDELGGGMLSDARAKGSNAGVKSYLANMRAQAEIYYDSKGSYGKSSLSGSCDTSSTIFSDNEMAKLVAGARGYLKDQDNSSISCYSSPQAWAVSASLIEVDGVKGYWCVDSMGSSKQIDSPITSTNCS